MANIGEATEIINASEVTLEVGTDTYVTTLEMHLHVGRPEDRTATTDAGALYTYGKGDNWLTVTLLATTPELGDSTPTYNFLTKIDADGDLPSRAWKFVTRDLAGNKKTWAIPGFLREYDVRKPREGKAEIDLFIRITDDTITIS